MNDPKPHNRMALPKWSAARKMYHIKPLMYEKCDKKSGISIRGIHKLRWQASLQPGYMMTNTLVYLNSKVLPNIVMSFHISLSFF